jgi:predicted metal-binding protein
MPALAGIVTCHCPSDNAVALAAQLKAKGAEVIMFCTCAFLERTPEGWIRENVFCVDIDRIVEKIGKETGIACKKVIAPLPETVMHNDACIPPDRCKKSC